MQQQQIVLLLPTASKLLGATPVVSVQYAILRGARTMKETASIKKITALALFTPRSVRNLVKSNDSNWNLPIPSGTHAVHARLAEKAALSALLDGSLWMTTATKALMMRLIDAMAARIERLDAQVIRLRSSLPPEKGEKPTSVSANLTSAPTKARGRRNSRPIILTPAATPPKLATSYGGFCARSRIDFGSSTSDIKIYVSKYK